ncbi:MAG: polymer-forming cytoskeletal protein [Alphaproteobacteria bacterium]|nr:polymer-forming cytoskeletal protein [Alphaproteobacteria bacterium]
MFRRKEDGSDSLIQDGADDVIVTTPEAAESVRSVAANDSVRPVQAAPATPAQPAYRPAAPSAAMAAARPAAPAPAPAPQPAAPALKSNTKRVLTVGPDIQMKGEITTCDRVVIEGMVDATMKDVHTVELAQSGALKGTAEVEDAEISGTFEGDLVVRGRLIIYSTGRVNGNVTYGEIEIERGGQLSGSIRTVKEAGAKGTATKRVA